MLPAEVPGRLWVRGASVMDRYLDAPGETARTAIPASNGTGGWSGSIGVVEVHGELGTSTMAARGPEEQCGPTRSTPTVHTATAPASPSPPDCCPQRRSRATRPGRG
ncbi:hypothetical protein GCM10023175_04260 [Pseudonocardia xishanensis]|uniref:AMP-binding enzyme n=1 Tax=Pseudonocardia xishanensis TaxID=630995 RepID=A0ABP8REP4_9PSEU